MDGSYQEALEYLYSFVNFEHRQIDQYAPENISLERPAHLLDLLGNPHLAFQSIHIAGTKGKGSVSAMCAACLRAAGYTVGLYTSPHLLDFRDRIRILSPDDADGRITPERVVALVDRLKQVVDAVPGLTWYELITAIGFLHFAQEHVDVAVVEVGLGGRLDATNVLTPLVSVITSLSLDHTYLLGDSLKEIAIEKAGIIKPGVPVVSAPQASEAMIQLVETARSKLAPMTVIGRDWDYEPGQHSGMDLWAASGWKQKLTVTKAPATAIISPMTTLTLALAGRHQQENTMVALAALDAIRKNYPALTAECISEGLANVVWPGRLQVLSYGQRQPTLLVDCAHNVDSAEKLAWALIHDYEFKDLLLVIGVTVDKDVTGILKVLLPITDRVILTVASHPRASDPETLHQLVTELGHEAQISHSVWEAVLAAWQKAGPDDLICVTGSIFVVGDLLNNWEGLQSELAAVSVHLEAGSHC